jgi:hypothetical protein
MSVSNAHRPHPEFATGGPGNDIQGKSKLNPNWAKLSQIQQSPAKSNQGRSLDFLVRIEPYQGLARTPQGVFSFACSVRPHRLARVGPPLRPGASLFSMSASFNCGCSGCSAASPFLEGIMAQIPRICKQMSRNRQNARNSGRLGTRPLVPGDVARPPHRSISSCAWTAAIIPGSRDARLRSE